MLKLVTIVLFMCVATLVLAQPSRPLEECVGQAPYGFPQQASRNATTICRTAYALMHDNDARIASWVTYTLRSERAIGCFPRINLFVPDPALPRGQRSELIDYANSGFDTGHIASNADMSWDPAVARESFVLSNAAPQLPALNRGAWRQLESATRAWAHALGPSGSLTIYAGSVFNPTSSRRIGPSGVVVPDAFYKIIVDNLSRQSLAFIFPHKDVADFRLVQVTVSQVEEATGIRFPIPDDPTRLASVWRIDHSAYIRARRQKCTADAPK